MKTTRFAILPAIALLAASCLSAQNVVLSFAPATLNLGIQLVGTTGTPIPEQLKNIGTVPLLVSGLRTLGRDRDDFIFASGTVPTTIAPGASLVLNATFIPRAPWRPGTRDARLKITTDQGIYSLALTGMGVSCAGPVPAASSNGMCADTDGDGFNDAWEDNGYIDLNNNGQEDEGISSSRIVNSTSFPPLPKAARERDKFFQLSQIRNNPLIPPPSR